MTPKAVVLRQHFNLGGTLTGLALLDWYVMNTSSFEEGYTGMYGSNVAVVIWIVSFVDGFVPNTVTAMAGPQLVVEEGCAKFPHEIIVLEDGMLLSKIVGSERRARIYLSGQLETREYHRRHCSLRRVDKRGLL